MLQKQFDDITVSHNDENDLRSGCYVVGADIGGTNLRIALADMAGIIVGKQSVSTIGIRDADVVVHLICAGIDSLLREHSLLRNCLRAIAVGAPGITDTDQGVVIATSYLMGWDNVPLRALLESALCIPAAVDNDVNLAALGESRAGAARGFNNFVFVAIGTGVGAGIVLNGQIFRGDGWTAGEIGYMLVPGTSEAPAEHGKPGALESIAGGEGVKAQWQTRWCADCTTLPKDATATQIFDHALEGNLLAHEILQFSAQTLAYAIYNISLVLNCPLFVLGGGVGLHPALIDEIRRSLRRQSEHAHPTLVESELGSEAQLIGSIFLALETDKIRNSMLAVSFNAASDSSNTD